MQRLAISWRLYSLVLLSLVILGGAMVFSLFQSYASSERERKAGLAQMNDVALTVLKKYQALETSGAMTREQAQTEAKAVISVMRYGDGSGYFWLNDMLPRMIMHPIKAEPERQGPVERQGSERQVPVRRVRQRRQGKPDRQGLRRLLLAEAGRRTAGREIFACGRFRALGLDRRHRRLCR